MEPIRVLVIDDNEDDRFLYQRALSEGGEGSFAVQECNNGEEGLNQAVREEADCVLLDYSLPGRNGIEILKRLRLFAPFLPVVMLTGQGNEALAISAIREGAQNYISKASITPETLRRVIRLSIEHAAMERRIVDQKQSLEVFTRALAHDLREPIRTIRCFMDILENSELSENKVLEYRRFVRQAAERMDSLIDSVYTLLRADARANADVPVQCDAAEALSIAESNVRALLNEREASVTHAVCGTCTIPVEQLARVFQNLIVNAVQHTKEKPKIHISSEEKSDRMVFRVQDNGPGIAQESRDKLFQPFAKISMNPQNLGLGLSICKRITEAFGGGITYESSPETGTAFFIELPKGGTASAGPKPTPKEEPAPQRNEKDFVARVLLVDDSPADTELARYALFEEGKMRCDFLTATNGHEAIKILSRARADGDDVDLVLLDINMPGLDGFETLAEIRARPDLSELPVLMCTTSAYEGDKGKAAQNGADGYIVKPLTVEALAVALRGQGSVSLTIGSDGATLNRSSHL